MTIIKDAYELRKLYKANNPEGCFFSPLNMVFFGDTMENFGLKQHTTNDNRVYYELYRKEPSKVNGMYDITLSNSHYFDSAGDEIIFLDRFLNENNQGE